LRNSELTPFDFDDETIRRIHPHLHSYDDPYYFIAYTSNRKYDYSDANQFISNFKKSPLKRGMPEYWHKERAIDLAANVLRDQLPNEWLADSTFVPIPPSKTRDHPEYDDRVTQVLTRIGSIDVREIVYQLESMDATHMMGESRHSIEDLVANYRIDENLIDPEPNHIVIVDDMLTAGKHLRAMRRVLGNQFPDAKFSAVFLARRIFAEVGE
jgi:predicted amidophosphoribosyltransferase